MAKKIFYNLLDMSDPSVIRVSRYPGKYKVKREKLLGYRKTPLGEIADIKTGILIKWGKERFYIDYGGIGALMGALTVYLKDTGDPFRFKIMADEEGGNT